MAPDSVLLLANPENGWRSVDRLYIINVNDMQSRTFWRNKHPEPHQILLWSGDDYRREESSDLPSLLFINPTPAEIHRGKLVVGWKGHVVSKRYREERGRRRERTGGCIECWIHWELTWRVLFLANVSLRLVYGKVNWLFFWQINTVWVTTITTMVETFEWKITSCYIFNIVSYRDGTWGTWCYDPAC